MGVIIGTLFERVNQRRGLIYSRRLATASAPNQSGVVL